MPLAEFPLPSVSGSNPAPLHCEQLPEAFNVGSTEYDDKGRDFVLQSGGNGVKRWRLLYDGLTAALAAILDAHKDSAKLSEEGLSANAFDFRDPKTGTLYSGVRYERYEVSHVKDWSQARTISLVKFP